MRPTQNRIPPVPTAVTVTVDMFVDEHLADTRKYANSSPLDEGGVFSLHRLAADLYAMGFDDGARSEGERARAAARRERDAQKHQTGTAPHE